MQELKGAKMKWKNRLTNYNFWISIVSAVLLILQAFNFEFDIAYINEIATAVLGLLVVIGIISDPTKTYTPYETNQNASEETSNADETTIETEVETEQKAESISADVENKNANVYSKSNFKAIVDFLSEEINKTIKKTTETSQYAVNNNLQDSKEILEENDIKEENPTCYNIVNQ